MTARPNQNIAGIFVLFPAILFLAWLVGLIWFYAALPQPKGPVAQIAEGQAKPVDGIIVLTGSPARIHRGFDLLVKGHGNRLLISGVNGDISDKTLKSALINRAAPGQPGQSRLFERAEYSRWFDCCVDLDRNALDTVGNAREGALWAAQQGYRSLYIVTGRFHMPRSMVEMQRGMPGLTLRPFPVEQRSVAGLSLLAEYHKYLLTLLHLPSALLQPRN